MRRAVAKSPKPMEFEQLRRKWSFMPVEGTEEYERSFGTEVVHIREVVSPSDIPPAWVLPNRVNTKHFVWWRIAEDVFGGCSDWRCETCGALDYRLSARRFEHKRGTKHEEGSNNG